MGVPLAGLRLEDRVARPPSDHLPHLVPDRRCDEQPSGLDVLPHLADRPAPLLQQPGDQLLQLAHERYDQRVDRILDAYHPASNEHRPLLRWLGVRNETDVPTPDGLTKSRATDLLRGFGDLLPYAAA